MFSGMPEMMGGVRFALGGGIILILGLFLTGIAVLAINIVVLIKVARIEKMQRQEANKPIERS